MRRTAQDNTRPIVDAHEAMERLNADAAKLHIWLRTQADAPTQRPWFREAALPGNGEIANGRVGAGQLKALPHHWRWSQVSPYLDRIAEIARSTDGSPIELTDRRQIVLTNRGLGGRLQVANTIRCAVSIYNPGDAAPVHAHTPNASRTILSPNGGYTNIEGERCEAARGDLILTPNGAWHDRGNDGAEPVIWLEVLDSPLLEFLDCVWFEDAFADADGKAQAQPLQAAGPSRRVYGNGGMIPAFVAHQRGVGRKMSPMIHYRGVDIRAALEQLRLEAGDPYEAITLRFVHPATGEPVFPTLDYSARLLRGGEETRFKRETSATVYVVMEGCGATEIAGQRFNWEPNDIFVVPSFLWRRHLNRGRNDAVLYAVSEQPLMEKIGQYRAQGRATDGTVVELH